MLLTVGLAACGSGSSSPSSAVATAPTAALSAPPVGTSPVATSAASSASPSAREARVAHVYDEFRATGPGCAVAISDGGVVAFSQGFGLADLSTAASITPSTVFEVASVAKQFTAADVLLLAADRKLSLDDDIHEYVPELPAYGASVTLRDLVWMESGINLTAATTPWAPTEVVTKEQLLAAIASQTTLDFRPGSAFAYSNANYLLLRRVIERTSGESLDTFTKQRLFGPAGMTVSAFRDDAGLAPLGEAVGYIVSPSFAYQPMAQHWDLQGDAGLHTNVLDLLGWAGHVASGTVGGQALLDAQRQAGPQPVPASVAPAGTAYAAGLFVSPYRGEQLLWHTGVFSNFRAAIGILPSSHIAVALACNTSLAVPDALLISTLDAWLGYTT